MLNDVPQQPHQDHEHGDASPEQRIVALGSESPRARAMKSVAPWLLSLALHAAIIVIGCIVTWSVVLMNDRPTRTFTADFDAMAFDPVAVLDAAPSIDDIAVHSPAELDVEAANVDDPFDMDAGVLDLLPESLAGASPSDFAPPPVQGAASFLGLSTSNAQRIVYVIDASGGMIPYLRVVLQELMRSLEGLTNQQSFSVVFFQQNEYLMVPPQRRWIPATDAEKRRVVEWIDANVVPAGRSNPLAAFEVALRMKPDVIFLLSDNITGSGIYEIDQADLLARLDELNPVDRLTNNRPTQINCIQFLDPDPLETLRLIGEAHGGERGYKFLSRGELGLASQEPR